MKVKQAMMGAAITDTIFNNPIGMISRVLLKSVAVGRAAQGICTKAATVRLLAMFRLEPPTAVPDF
jgi:hypothetical protein